MITTIIIFLLILSLLVFVHEFGHFIAAKKLGVKVEEFAIGFPPRMFKIMEKNGTEYTINWIPIGGFVRLKGEDGSAKKDKDSFAGKELWEKFVILASGVGMNFLLAIVVISIGFMIGFPQYITAGNIDKNARVKDTKVQVMGTLQDSPADIAGILSGDIIIAINNGKIEKDSDVTKYINENKEAKMILEIERGDEVIQKEIYATQDIKDEDGNLATDNKKYMIGVSLAEIGIVSYPVHYAFYKGVETTFFFTRAIIFALYEFFKNLITVHKATVEFTGFIGIAVETGKVMNTGFIYLLQFIALLSINLAIINFIPFPALDGGRILFLAIEKVRGKAVDEKIENMIHNTGFALLMVLIIFITYRDVMNYKSAFIDFFRKIF